MGERYKQTVRRGFRLSRWFVLWLLCFAAVPVRAEAEGLSGYLELSYSNLDTRSEDATGNTTKTDSESLLQRYNITLDKKLFPNLTLLAGGFFERRATSTETDGTDIDTTLTRVRPEIQLRLRTPLYLVETLYNRTEEKQKNSGSSSITTVQENYYSTLQWRPDGFPDLKLQYFRTNLFDRDRRFQDSTDDRFRLTSEYKPAKSLFLRYEGLLAELDNRVEDILTRELSHAGQVVYTDRWWRGRVTVHSDYNVSYGETEIIAGAGGEVVFPVPAFAGLSAVNDVPESGALDPNPALIDGNVTSGAGINLGLPPPGGDARPRNMGLDFASDTEVNRLLVWIDRDLPQGIADAFSWQVYTSEDNQDWSLRMTVSPARFDTFFHRFEIRFTNVTARYVKVVVSPLSPTIPSATGFPTVLVTELQAEILKSADEVRGTQYRTSHIYNLDIRTRILQAPILTHEFSYVLVKRDPAPSDYTVSNGVSASHRFTQKVFGVARIAREDGRQKQENRVAYLYTASLTAVPLETLRHSLVFSGREETTGGKKTDSKGVFLQNTAKLYEGIDVALGAGASAITSETGRETESTQVNAAATLIPNRKVTLNLYYTDKTSTSSGGDLPEETTEVTRTGEANLSVQPIQALYLFGSYRIERRSGQEKRDIQNYSLTFSPFPDGTLRFGFFYNETIRSDDDAKERIISPNIRWNITRRMYLDIAYSKITTDSITLSNDTEVISGTLRISF